MLHHAWDTAKLVYIGKQWTAETWTVGMASCTIVPLLFSRKHTNSTHFGYSPYLTHPYLVLESLLMSLIWWELENVYCWLAFRKSVGKHCLTLHSDCVDSCVRSTKNKPLWCSIKFRLFQPHLIFLTLLFSFSLLISLSASSSLFLIQKHTLEVLVATWWRKSRRSVQTGP